MQIVYEGPNYHIAMYEPDGGCIRDDDSVDVDVVFHDGRHYNAIFYTLKNVTRLMSEQKQRDPAAEGHCFWANHMIIVENLTRENVIAAVHRLLATGEVEHAFDLQAS